MSQLIGKEVEGHMHTSEAVLHWAMILASCGLWYPVYRHRLNKIHRTTRIYTA